MKLGGCRASDWPWALSPSPPTLLSKETLASALSCHHTRSQVCVQEVCFPQSLKAWRVCRGTAGFRSLPWESAGSP